MSFRSEKLAARLLEAHERASERDQPGDDREDHPDAAADAATGGLDRVFAIDGIEDQDGSTAEEQPSPWRPA